MNTKLVIILALLAACLLIVAMTRVVYQNGKVGQTSSVHEVAKASVKDDVDVKLVTELSPYMRSER
jgi:hypothetical protein